jgi:abequosyltransferase
MLTSIIILTHNKLEYTLQCIESIRAYIAQEDREIIVVDNHSADGTVEWLNGQKDIIKILNNENAGFPAGCNQGMRIAKGDNILLLNNDTVVTRNCLSNLLNCLYSSENIGAVGPVTNNCSNGQAIAVTYRDINEMHAFAAEHNLPDPDKWEERPRLVGYCMLIKKEVVDRIGLLDERFSPGNYEDNDYCLRMRIAGFRLMLCRDAFIHHYGSVSFGANRQEFLDLLETNRKKFEEKWGLKEVSNTPAPAEEPVNYYIDPSCDVRGIERMKIGRNAVVQKDCWLNIAHYNPSERYMIQIGEGSNIGKRNSISAANRIIIGKHVITGANIHITDHNHEYRQIGRPIVDQGIYSVQGEGVIGDGCWFGINCAVVGNVHIGKGCVIGANSVVTKDIPDYCVAVGNPAKPVKMFDIESGDWVRIKSKKHLKELLEKRESQMPLLSVCIPTYNRAGELEICLSSIFSQIGDDLMIEVVVCDNASTDQTEKIADKYRGAFKNLKYHRNTENIGPERNTLKAVEISSGKYVMLHGDDDFFKQDTLYTLLDVINRNRQAGLLFLNVLNDNRREILSKGMDSYLSLTSIYSTFISSVIFRRDAYDRIPEPGRFVGSNINQVYLQYCILEQNPNFCFYNNSAFTYSANEAKGYNFGEVFIKNYLDILYYFADKGLSAEVIRTDKKNILEPFIFLWYKRIFDNGMQLDVSNFEDIFTEYYKDEPYIESALNTVKSIKKNSKKA